MTLLLAISIKIILLIVTNINKMINEQGLKARKLVLDKLINRGFFNKIISNKVTIC